MLVSTTTWPVDGANTTGVPSRSSPPGGVRVTLLEHLRAPRPRTQTTVLPSPLAISYATARAPFDSTAALAPPEPTPAIVNGLISGCGSPLTPLTPPLAGTADAAPAALPSATDAHSSPAVTAARTLQRTRLINVL